LTHKNSCSKIKAAVTGLALVSFFVFPARFQWLIDSDGSHNAFATETEARVVDGSLLKLIAVGNAPNNGEPSISLRMGRGLVYSFPIPSAISGKEIWPAPGISNRNWCSERIGHSAGSCGLHLKVIGLLLYKLGFGHPLLELLVRERDYPNRRVECRIHSKVLKPQPYLPLNLGLSISKLTNLRRFRDEHISVNRYPWSLDLNQVFVSNPISVLSSPGSFFSRAHLANIYDQQSESDEDSEFFPWWSALLVLIGSYVLLWGWECLRGNQRLRWGTAAFVCGAIVYMYGFARLITFR
jgi:hypothetical protein